MCTGSKSKLCPSNMVMEGIILEQKDGVLSKTSILLELSAADDLDGFKFAVEHKGFNIDESSYWYGRTNGSKKMEFIVRTPLMIASAYGSAEVLKYIIGTNKVDVNRACGSDGATALHCAASSGLASSSEIVRLLLDASADINSVDANGNKPLDLIAPFLKWSSFLKWKTVEMMLKGSMDRNYNNSYEVEKPESPIHQLSKEVPEKKEYPLDISLPDINIGLYGSDEFRMYSFKVKPCSRAYSHDWTECPFVHPGENARRRDPMKYNYTCVPCPEFRKGSCGKGDSCEYAHGVFESWLHPAQYRTRLCKDETGCARKVCFFAHKPEELRPLYASTGSAMPSPKSSSSSAMDMATSSPLAHGSTSTPPMSPSAQCSSPMGGSMWQNKVNPTPPMLQLPGSRLKTALNARDFELERELFGLGSLQNQHQLRQQLIDEMSMSSLSSPSYLKPTNLDSVFGSLDPSILSQLQGLSPMTTATTTQLQSPSGLQMRQNVNQLRSTYPSSSLSSSPLMKPSMYGFDSSGSVAAAVMNSRSSAFAKRSQSFIDRGAMNNRFSFAANANSGNLMSSNLSDWGSPDGKLDWGFQGEETSKLKKSASFGIRSGNNTTTKTAMGSPNFDEPDVSWVNSLVKDVSSGRAGLYSSDQNHRGVHEKLPPWVEQMYIEQEQIVA